MRILIIEDEHRIAGAIQKGLIQERFAVDVAYDGNTGYDLATTEEYDTIIMDVMLPEKNGIDVCIALRQNGNHVPVLMLTAKGQTQDKVEGLNSGADDYLTKPFSFDELLARVRALTRRPKTILKSTLQLENLTLNTQTFETTRNGIQIQLTGKEFSLLEFLLRHAGRTLTKEQIIEHVWNYDADILPNTVEAYIRLLREKIDRPYPNSPQLIQTVRGFGYKIAEK